MAAKLKVAVGKFALHCKQIGAIVYARKAAEFDPYAPPPPPPVPPARCKKLPAAEVAAALRAAAGAVQGRVSLVVEARRMLAGTAAQQCAALAAVLPNADGRRGDGVLLAALSVATVERAAAYLRAVMRHAAPAAAQTAAVAGAVAAAAFAPT